MTEDQMLNRVAVEMALDHLEKEESRVVLALSFELECPADWGKEPWPPTYAAIGRYVGTKFRGGPLSEAAIRYIRDRSLREIKESAA